MKNSQKGFIIPLLIAIIAILVIGGGTYIYLNNKNQTVLKSIQTTSNYNTVAFLRDGEVWIKKINQDPYQFTSTQGAITEFVFNHADNNIYYLLGLRGGKNFVFDIKHIWSCSIDNDKCNAQAIATENNSTFSITAFYISPNGKYLAFQSGGLSGSNNYFKNIRIINLQTKEVKNSYTSDESPLLDPKSYQTTSLEFNNINESGNFIGWYDDENLLVFNYINYLKLNINSLPMDLTLDNIAKNEIIIQPDIAKLDKNEWDSPIFDINGGFIVSDCNQTSCSLKNITEDGLASDLGNSVSMTSQEIVNFTRTISVPGRSSCVSGGACSNMVIMEDKNVEQKIIKNEYKFINGYSLIQIIVTTDGKPNRLSSYYLYDSRQNIIYTDNNKYISYYYGVNGLYQPGNMELLTGLVY